MKNINELLHFGYSIENFENRIFRIKNSYGDLIASIFVNSGAIIIPEGKIFNYKLEIREAIKKIGTNKFLNL